jgi:hypothetical protein
MKRYILASLLAFLVAGCGGGETSVSKDIDRKTQSTQAPKAQTKIKTVVENRVQADVQQSKRFFNELRAQAMSLTDYQHSGNPGFLDTESESIGIELNKIATMGQSLSLWLAVLYKDVESMELKGTKGADKLEKSNYIVQRTEEGHYQYSIADTWKGTLIISNIEKVDVSGVDTIHIIANGTFPKHMDKIATLNTKQNTQLFNAKANIIKPTDTNASIRLLEANLEDNATELIINDMHVDVNYDIEKIDKNQNFKNIEVKVNKLLIAAKTPTYKMSGNIFLDEYVTNKTLVSNRGSIPSKLKFTGGITNLNSKGDIHGNIDVLLKNAKDINLTDANIKNLNLKVYMSATIQMPDRPAMTSYINYNTDNISYQKYHELTFDYSYDKTTISGIVSFDKNRKYGNITLASGSGVAMKVTIVNGNIAYGNRSQVTRHGKVVGELQERESVPVIKYIDGSFESLP